jgi:hypothetical protein
MRLLKAIWENTYGLLVDDGRLAAGAVLGLIATALLTALAPNETVRDLGGPLLLTWVCVLLLSNLYTAGRSAARKRETRK